MTTYENEMVPDPSVAAIREKMDPDVPPARNFRWPYLTGLNITSANLDLLLPVVGDK